jgi:hypothetical protein
MINKATLRLSYLAVALLMMLIIFCVVAVWLQNRQIAFDAQAWKSAPNVGSFDVRYNMVDDVKARIQRMPIPSLQNIETMLGPAEMGDVHSKTLHYEVGRRAIGPVRLQGWYMYMQFDDNKMLIDIRVVPQ